MVFFGDGAVHQGAIHETFNLASVWGLPIVFVVENNQYGMGTALSRVSSLEPLHEMADAYKIRHYEFNGMDLLESYDAFADAVDYAREQSRPVYLEARCSRFRGHSMSDPGKYRTKEQLEEEKAHDPIPGFAAFLVDCGVTTHEALEALDETVKTEMKLVLERAEAAPWPDPELISKYVLVNS
jgi:pyruvate dehydrogenase E1 component alpha subunit